MERSTATTTSGRAVMNASDFSRRFPAGRPIPKRGQVKMGIVVGLANSVASVFTPQRPGMYKQHSSNS
ncbi:hypothetical protein RchiOBHm_Chr5g0006801 [Rosa chinensis]|uniref:Uncharacterized protein n=1 Tax=Rosa chinensis TaxID=74649 RepID=A0A2P6Q3N3_ROSCH|nr:hypothetical protein RchiOBHm_Chr5g0006801 [Rosa chinensis]